jgi:hypothetical protein
MGTTVGQISCCALMFIGGRYSTGLDRSAQVWIYPIRPIGEDGSPRGQYFKVSQPIRIPQSELINELFCPHFAHGTPIM